MTKSPKIEMKPDMIFVHKCHDCVQGFHVTLVDQMNIKLHGYVLSITQLKSDMNYTSKEKELIIAILN